MKRRVYIKLRNIGVVFPFHLYVIKTYGPDTFVSFTRQEGAKEINLVHKLILREFSAILSQIETSSFLSMREKKICQARLSISVIKWNRTRPRLSLQEEGRLCHLSEPSASKDRQSPPGASSNF